MSMADDPLEPVRVARAPGKIILAGEHAVVHGCPALVTAVQRYATVHVRVTGERRDPRKGIDERYAAYLDGVGEITEVVKEPMDLAYYAAAEAGPDGVAVEVRSDIPIGAGMGSSAAVLLATIRAANPELGPEEIAAIAKRAEDRQHGHSSGVDIRVCQHGGTWRIQNGRAGAPGSPGIPDSAGSAEQIDELLHELQLVHTGEPRSSTGECVTEVGKHFPASDPIWDAFRDCVECLEDEFFPDVVNEVQALLERIGVVPDQVADFAADVRSLGLAGKVCGAGAVHGSAAGMFLVTGGELPDDLLERYDYHQFSVEVASDGLVLVQG